MKKKIFLSNGTSIIFDTDSNSGYEDILNFYEPKLNRLVSSWTNIPYHDKDDLIQICRIKLLEALKTFNTKKKINFSTYAYTIINRKIFQVFSRYKNKRNSGFIANDCSINLNHKYDKSTEAQFLLTYEDKCPLKNKYINKNICLDCKFHVRYENKKISKGENKDKIKNYTLCKYYKQIMERRGVKNKSLDKLLNNNDNLLSYISCNKQKKYHEDEEFRIEFNRLKNYLKPEQFIILQMLLDGFYKYEIIKHFEMTNLKFLQIIKKISNNKKVKELLLKK